MPRTPGCKRLVRSGGRQHRPVRVRLLCPSFVSSQAHHLLPPKPMAAKLPRGWFVFFNPLRPPIPFLSFFCPSLWAAALGTVNLNRGRQFAAQVVATNWRCAPHLHHGGFGGKWTYQRPATPSPCGFNVQPTLPSVPMWCPTSCGTPCGTGALGAALETHCGLHGAAVCVHVLCPCQFV